MPQDALPGAPLPPAAGLPADALRPSAVLSARVSEPRLPRPGRFRGLSLRLLVLTAVFVMVAQALIFVPSVAGFRVTVLEDRLNAALLALTAVEAHPEGMVDAELQRRLLSQAGTLGMEARPAFGTGWETHRMVGPDRPLGADAFFDITDRPVGPLIADALAALARAEDRHIVVRGRPSTAPDMVVEVMIAERPLIEAMREYGLRVLGMSLVISLMTAALVFLSLHLLLVRPLWRLTDSMQDFREAPTDPARILVPSSRRDEVGMAERELAALQTRLREALDQQARLAAVGTAVAKVSHDLKGILSTAVLESDRLEQSAAGGAEVREVTRGIAGALDRAISLTSATLRYVKQGPPVPALRSVALRPLAQGAAAAAATAEGRLVVEVAVGPEIMVLGDPDLLLRALENLLRNAAQAGAGRVTVTARARSDQGDVVLRVADDGPGLPARARANLFVPFSGSARAGGTGLGLPIARDLIRAMGGELELEATSRDGTTFRAVLRSA